MDLGSITYYSISPRMLNRLATLHHRLGEVHARHLHRPPVDLEKAYHVSTVHSTLAIEGGTLDALPVADILNEPGSAAKGTSALEAVNTHRAYGLSEDLDPFLERDLRHAHGVLMHGLALVYIVNWKRDLRIGVAAHWLLNTVGSLELLVAIFR